MRIVADYSLLHSLVLTKSERLPTIRKTVTLMNDDRTVTLCR